MRELDRALQLVRLGIGKAKPVVKRAAKKVAPAVAAKAKKLGKAAVKDVRCRMCRAYKRGTLKKKDLPPGSRFAREWGATIEELCADCEDDAVLLAAADEEN